MRIADRTQQTVGEVLTQTVGKHGDKTFLVSEARSITYAEIDRESNCLARGVISLGIGRKDAVLVLLPDTVDFVTVWISLAKIAAIEVPVNRDFRGNLLARVINHSGAKALIVDYSYLDRIEAVAQELETLRQIVVYPELDQSKVPQVMLGRFDFVSYKDLLSETEDPIENAARCHDLVAILYTSGTTGPSKGVTIYHAHAYEYANCTAEVLDLSTDDVYFGPLPLFHIAGQWAVVYAAMIANATVVLTDRFSVSRFWDIVTHHCVTTTLLLEVMANFLLSRPEGETDAKTPLKKVHMSPVISNVHEFKRRFGVEVTTDFASTEMCVPLRAGFEAGNSGFYDVPDHRSCGRVVSDRFEVRLVDDLDQEVPVGKVGELVVRAKDPWILMAGYWKDPEATVKAWRNLWLHTGDAFYRDEAGDFYFVDRLKDVIRRRGENISSADVEGEISTHPAVLECAAVAVKSEFGEDEVMVFVTPKPEVAMTPEDLIDFLEPRIPPFMIPRFVEITGELPKTPTGKIQKYPLRDRGVGEHTWDREAARS